MTPADKILQKAMVASGLSSAQWERVRAEIRDRAFFSARIEEARYLHVARKAVADMLRKAGSGRGTIMSREDAIRAIQDAAVRLGLSQGTGRITDPGSRARAKLVVDTNAAMAAGYARYRQDLDSRIGFPCRELVRAADSHPEKPRDWRARWTAAGGRLFDGRMVARVEDPVWSAISRFGLPYPPFDYNSGMIVEMVPRAEAVRLGAIEPDERPRPVEPRGFNDGLQAELPMRHDSPEAQALLADFGDQVRFDGDVFHWRGELIRDVLAGKVPRARLGRGFDGRDLPISHAVFAQHLGKHVGGNERDRRNIPLTEEDFELLPSIWRAPDRASRGRNRDHLELDALDGGVLHLVVDPQLGIVSFFKSKDPGGA